MRINVTCEFNLKFMNNELNFTLITNNFNQVSITHSNVKCKTQIVGTNLITCVALYLLLA